MNAPKACSLLRLYVVGQDDAAREELHETLCAHGYTVGASATIRALAPDAVQAANPDLLVLDLDTLAPAEARACALVHTGD